MHLMAAGNAELEVVEYRVSDISHVTFELIYNFAEYSGIAGTVAWMGVGLEILPLIRNQRPVELICKGRGINVALSYFALPEPETTDEGVIFSSPEPTIAFSERPESITPTLRTHVSRVTDAIAREMEEVYHLRVEKDPLRLVFPKEEYAKSIDYFNVALLQPVESNPS